VFFPYTFCSLFKFVIICVGRNKPVTNGVKQVIPSKNVKSGTLLERNKERERLRSRKAENTAVGIRHAHQVAPSIRNSCHSLTSPTSGGLSVAIVRSRTQATEFVFCSFVWYRAYFPNEGPRSPRKGGCEDNETSLCATLSSIQQ
jgi:hypothetical protein